MKNPWRPPPAPPGFGKDKTMPQFESSFLSQLLFNWLSPFLSVGFSRPLQKEDLWALPHSRQAHNLTDAVEANFFARCPPDHRPAFLSHKPSAFDTYAESEGDSEHTAGKDNGQGKSSLDEKGAEKGGSDELPDVNEKENLDSEGLPDVEAGDGTKSQAKKKSWFRRQPKKAKTKTPKSPYDSSLVKALHTTFFWRWWTAGALKLIGDTLTTTTPLVNKALLAWLTDAFAHHLLPGEFPKPRGVGYGIGLSIALFVMQEVSSLATNHYFMTAMTTGLAVRTALVGNIFRKSLRLSGKARLEHSVGQITTMISTDATRLDLSSAFFHNVWVAPIQIILGVALLINNLGYSALVGLGVLIFGFPVQFIMVRIMFKQRKKGVKLTDKRVRLTTEVLQGVRLIKFYAWEAFYGHQIGTFRERELRTILKAALARSGLFSAVTMIPILASILSFITYALSGHALTPAVIFSSLQFFNIIRAPLIFLPVVLSAVSDAVVALGRIGKFLTAEELSEPYAIDSASEDAIVVDGDFTWETTKGIVLGAKFEVKGKGKGKAEADKEKKEKKEKAKKDKKDKKNKKDSVLPVTAPGTDSDAKDSDNQEQEDKPDEKPFQLNGLKVSIPRGAFVAIVGRVGCGKSSFLQALTGEMRRTQGEIVFGGTVAYVPQVPWIMNATLRENVLFGRDDDDDRFNEIVHACSLVHDLEMLPYGEQTEIGEKGINLSGGQKARVSLARAAYSNSDIILMDDPLSAVDAHVGKAILDDCLLSGPLANKTRVLVTHALHVLAKTDYIYVMENGAITEQGTYQTLVKDGQSFSRLIEEFGSPKEEEQEGEKQGDPKEKATEGVKKLASGKPGAGAALMSEEERETGAVSLSVYKRYLRHAGGVLWGPIILLLLVLTQGASVTNNLFLGFWTAESIHGFSQGQYIGVYSALGGAQAVFSFITSFTVSLVGVHASLSLFKAALNGVLRSPTSFFDTTPMGRILSRLSKDQDTLDTQLALTFYSLLTIFGNVLGTVALVFYTFPYLGIIFAPLSVLYYVVSAYYRRSSVETKRLDSILRSALYASYQETLTGLATVRAYRRQDTFIRKAEHGLDLENRAYYMTVSIQRWLSVRLDFFGNILILGIALFALGFRTSVNPSKVGVVLSYTLGITQIFSEMVSQYAQNEQNMNAVERVLVYAELPPEGAPTTPNDPDPSWPQKGEIVFEGVQMAYRENLPLVLKDVSFAVKPGEKVGFVGRTGAGKSSLLQALFRVVELQKGKIEIDGKNIADIGLDVLRRGLALVPQDSTLFLGTLRENLDPEQTRTDAEMISALRRAWLLPKEGEPADPVAEAKFALDTTVSDEGGNFSAGEKQLLALCRALIKGSRIIVLDEATSSVDFETDAKLQKTIQTEFSSCTLLCIAHRLNTIVYYDRILVMDGGRVAEFDTPLNLFDQEQSIFRSLCDEARLTRQDIVRIRNEVAKHKEMIALRDVA